MWSRIKRRPNGGSSTSTPNFWGDGSNGSLSTTGNVTYGTGNSDSSTVILQFDNLTINAGHTLTLAGRARALVLYVQRDFNLQGRITMNLGASAIASSIIVDKFDVNGLTNSVYEPSYNVIFATPAAGANGGAAVTSTGDGTAGTAGTNGRTGGGGSGAFNSAGGGTRSGAGAQGTAYSGGAGGGGYSFTTAGQAGGANGGKGGNGTSFTTSAYHAGGGAGNPGGTGTLGSTNPYAPYVGSTGTGGTLLIMVGGTYTQGASSVILCNGASGGAANQATTGNVTTGGGGSGGGRVIQLYGTTLSGTASAVQANGGAAGIASGGSVNNNGGAGGAGTITIQQVGK